MLIWKRYAASEHNYLATASRVNQVKIDQVLQETTEKMETQSEVESFMLKGSTNFVGVVV